MTREDDMTTQVLSSAVVPDPDTHPSSFLRSDLEAAGFRGWRTWDALRASGFTGVCRGPAAYVVYRPSAGPPTFLTDNPAHHFKGKDPSVAIDTLGANWVAGAHVIYIGKAEVADRRVKQFADFGAGRPVGHWGGRLIWQLADSAELLVAWHAISWGEAARSYEKRLLRHFASLYSDSLPFANLMG